MDKTALATKEEVIVNRFRELSEDGKQRLEDYAEFLYQREKSQSEAKNHDFFSEQERNSLAHIVRRVREFSKEKPTIEAQKALRRLCEGLFESEEDIASDHDSFLYGFPKTK